MMDSSVFLRATVFARGLCGFLLLVILAGCSSQPVAQTQDPGALTEFSQVYMAATVGLDRAPANAQDLQAYLPAGKTAEQLSVSPNDGQPFVIVWGADPRTGMDLKPLVIAYEQKGTNGSRFVFTAMGVMLMSDEDFKGARFPAGHTPQLN